MNIKFKTTYHSQNRIIHLKYIKTYILKEKNEKKKNNNKLLLDIQELSWNSVYSAL